MKNSFALCRLYRCKDGTNIFLVLIQQVHEGHTIHSTKHWPDLQSHPLESHGAAGKPLISVCACQLATAVSEMPLLLVGNVNVIKKNFKACCMQSLSFLPPPETYVAPEPAVW